MAGVFASSPSEIVRLGDWQNFYVIVGSSAGALIGLTFIVITVAADRMGAATSPTARLTGLRTFITPTAVYFGSGLWVAALMCVPGQTVLTLGACLGITGAAGLLYCATVGSRISRASLDYRPFLSDWIWSVVLPLAAYLSLLATGWLLHAFPLASLYGVGATTLLLMFIGIHNAWDVVVWITTERHAHRERQRLVQHSAEESAARAPRER
ncbi:MAG TPA: hypothetical protein VMD49_04635 [Steroidobacteraceae bacterium]|nr:hypothetical protein [Steroidobacteraceae bacterium]